MTTLEDKILGEKDHYYCSSSEDEAEPSVAPTPPKDCHQWNGSSVNTGPKGVIKDWQRYKQLESESRETSRREQLKQTKKLSMTCAVDSDDDDDDGEGDDLFLKQYMMKRMQEMMARVDNCCKDRPEFGNLIHLDSSDRFLDAIDAEKPFVTIICHIYTNNVEECQDMNGCLTCLAHHYPRVKFCAIEASTAGMSRHFASSGVPALLVYKSTALVANYVRLTDRFQKPFFAVDIEKFLLDQDILKEEWAANGVSIESEAKGIGSIRESSLDANQMSDSSD